MWLRKTHVWGDESGSHRLGGNGQFIDNFVYGTEKTGEFTHILLVLK